jgi:hypothetical protein
MTTSDEIIGAVRILTEQISAHTGQPCSITLQHSDIDEGEYWTVLSDDVDIFLTAHDEDTLYMRVKAFSQGYAAALSTPSNGVPL